jgi:phosphoglycerol transferase
LAAYALCGAISLAAVGIRLQLWKADLRVPFAYQGDGMVTLTWAKSIVETGWWMTNSHLGAPYQLDMRDFPANATLHFLVLRGLRVFISDPAVLVNVYYVATFPLIALAGLAALRGLGISYRSGLVGAVLYAFLPYHFWRGESHLVLSAYYLVPLAILVVLRVARGESFLLVRREETGRLALDWKSSKTLLSLAVCAALGLDWPYYPFFACYFLLVAGVAGRSKSDSLALWRGVVLAGVVALTFSLNLIPNVLYRLHNGPNLAPDHEGKRSWVESETYALKPVQLLLPAANHRLPLLRRLHDKYYTGTTLPSEGDSIALGMVGASGLLFLLGCAVCCRRSESPRGELYYLLGLLVVAGILLGTVGGFGTILNLLTVPMIRCYNRVSLFVGFFALAGIGLLLDDLRRRSAAGRTSRRLAAGLLPCLLTAGIVDQTGEVYVQPYDAVKRENASDAAFVAKVESLLPEDAMVFQLPYVGFCSAERAPHQMQPYSHFRGYLQSHHLRWSFGAMHGRYADALHADVANRPLEESIRLLAQLGFAGVYVDRFGYADDGKEVEEALSRFLHAEAVVSDNGRLSFFPMGPYAERLKARYSPADWSRLQETCRATPRVLPGSGFLPEERDGSTRWLWCGETGRLSIVNPSGHVATVQLRFVAKTAASTTGALKISGALLTVEIPVGAAGTPYARTVAVPPGTHVLRFTCTAPPVARSQRPCVFGLRDCELAPLDAERDFARWGE